MRQELGQALGSSHLALGSAQRWSHHLRQTRQIKQPPSVSVQHLPYASLATQEIGPRNSRQAS